MAKRKSAKKGLAKRYQHSKETKESGRGGSNAYDFSNVDREIKYFKPKEGRNRIIVVPYVIKSKNHPLVKQGKMEIGDEDYVMDVWVHKNIGPAETDIICLKENYGKRCPVCDVVKQAWEDGEEKKAKDMKARRRVLYNVLNPKKRDAGVMVFEVSYVLFEKELIEEIQASTEGDEIIYFADPEDGSVIEFRGSTAKIGKNEFLEFKSFKLREFTDDDIIDEDELEDAISFDECLKVLSTEEIEAVLEGVDESESSKKSKKRKESEDDEDDEDDDEDDEPPKKTRKRKRPEPVDEDDDDDNGEDEDDEEQPKKSRKKASKKEADDEDEDEDDEEPVKAKSSNKSSKKKSSSKNKCPVGYQFGVDIDDFEECEDCEVWEECFHASEK